LGDPELARGAPETAALGHADEIAEVTEFHGEGPYRRGIGVRTRKYDGEWPGVG
jgi:hypothetical protein